MYLLVQHDADMGMKYSVICFLFCVNRFAHQFMKGDNGRSNQSKIAS